MLGEHIDTIKIKIDQVFGSWGGFPELVVEDASLYKLNEEKIIDIYGNIFFYTYIPESKFKKGGLFAMFQGTKEVGVENSFYLTCDEELDAPYFYTFDMKLNTVNLLNGETNVLPFEISSDDIGLEAAYFRRDESKFYNKSPKEKIDDKNK